MTIEIEHNGYKITYSENEDVWRCWELSVEDSALSIVKTKINKIGADARRVDNISGIHIEHSGRFTPCVITLIDKDHVWVVREEPGDRYSGSRKRRTKEPMSSIALDTPEVRQRIEECESAIQAAKEAGAKVHAAKDAIPRVTADVLMAATKATTHEAP